MAARTDFPQGENMTKPQAHKNKTAVSLSSLKPSGTIHLSRDDAIAFRRALSEPVVLTPEQIELGKLMRSLPDDDTEGTEKTRSHSSACSVTSVPLW